MGHQLTGGNFDAGIFHVGDTVRRAAGEWTPAVHTLLGHLERCGFKGAPRAFGMDASGREVLSFIDGEVGHVPLRPYMRSDTALSEVARLLRRLHDITQTFSPPPNARWRQAPADPGPVEVVCHNDWGPHNAVFKDRRLVAFIDWDFARPGSRLWDLAWAAFVWVPLRTNEHCQAQGWLHPPDRAGRLRLFCDAYRLSDRRDILEAVRLRALTMAKWLEAGAAAGHPVHMRLVRQGHADSYRRDVAWIEANRPALAKALR